MSFNLIIVIIFFTVILRFSIEEMIKEYKKNNK